MAVIRHFIIGTCISIIWQLTMMSAPAWCADTDLYRVYMQNQQDADLLAPLPVDPLLRLPDGYLMLATPYASDRLKSSGLRYELIASGVNRDHLVLDRLPNLPEAGRYEVIFQDGATRLCRIDPAELADKTVAARFFPLPDRSLPIIYRPPLRLDKSLPVPPENLDTLVARMSQDSIVSYAEYIQSLNGRLTMTAGAQAARNYLVAKFREFGYDSVLTDTFSGPGQFEYDFVTGHNVIAYKIGTENPYHHIVIGAHYDTPMTMDTDMVSPGADDNGSGTIAVLEIARALSAVDTRQTIVFILFDAEEEGLVGAYGYARRAFENDDRIAFMVNMDMIGHYENDGEANIYWGLDTVNGELWASLAQSISAINITASLGSGYLSDDGPFLGYGWPTIGVQEYVFSTVYHSYRDSTTYLNFDYLTRMAQASLATAYVTDQQFVPDYELWMSFSPDPSDFIVPNSPAAINVAIREYGGAQLVPGSVQLHYSVNGGADSVIPMTTVGGDEFSADLPPFACFDEVGYFVTAEDDSLGTVYFPGQDEAVTATVATGSYATFEDYFDTDKGWTVTSQTFVGEWNRGNYHNDYDGNGFYYSTESIFAVMDGTTSLISPPITIDGTDCLFEYARWCTNTLEVGPITDALIVYIRNAAGGSWHRVESLAPTGSYTRTWQRMRFHVSDFMTPPQAVQLRFDATEFGHDSHLLAAVDAVRFIGFSTDTRVLTEDVPSWTAYHPYAQQLEAATCVPPLTWIDRFGQLGGSGLTLSSDGLLLGVPTKLGSIVFRAQATDQLGGYDEQILSLIIYDTLHVTTATIPSASLEMNYSCQLGVSGGTGTKTWSDRDDDLAGTGVALSESGLLSGTPLSEGDFPFTALVTDRVGATTEKAFTLHVVGPYVCGDADGDGMINVGDAVYIINYVFKGGPAPDPIDAGDANADGAVNVADAVYLVNFIFKGGEAPECP